MINAQERIKELMELMHWSEYRLAKESGISKSTISNLFRKNQSPGLATLQSICDTFGITLSQFLAEEGEAVPLSAEQREILILWGSLKPEQQEVVRRAMIQYSEE